jgi:UDP-N-acetylglucosamine 1-carboxyvinyltransferase
VKALHGIEFEVIYDRMEAGTYLLAGLMSGGEIEVEGYVEQDNIALTEILRKINAPFKIENDKVFTYRSLASMNGTFVKADVFPYFPTDMQPQMTALLTLCQGQSVVQDTVFPERNSHAEELRRFGARIFVRNQSIMINGVDELEGAPVMATDLRCAAALILAGLTANGDTLIQEVDHIFRGYDRIIDKLRGLGAVVDIK